MTAHFFMSFGRATKYLVVASCLALGMGCGSCGKKASKAPDSSVDGTSGSKGKKQSAKKAEAPPPPVEAPLTGTAFAIQVGTKAYLWTDGRNGALGHDIALLSWSEDGFELSQKGGYRVLGVGGVSYWRFSESRFQPRPLGDVITEPTEAPDGFSVDISVTRGGHYRATLSSPDSVPVRLGTYREEPIAEAWLQGKLPSNRTAAAKPDRAHGWQIDAEERVVHALPPSGESLPVAAIEQATLAPWIADLAKIRGASVTPIFSTLIDLDGDTKNEGVVCVTGGSGDYRCFAIADFDGETRYYGLNMPYQAGAPEAEPLAVKMGQGTYLVWTGPPSRAAADAAHVLHITRFTGAGYVTGSLH